MDKDSQKKALGWLYIESDPDWNNALTDPMEESATGETKVRSALYIIDKQLDGILIAPGTWGDILSIETIVCELLFMRAVLLGATPNRLGGAQFNRVKRKRFGSNNGPCSNWLEPHQIDQLVPLIRIAIESERERMANEVAVKKR